MRVFVVVLLAICAVSAFADDKGLSTTELIANRGYKFETHEAKTDDGYLLGVVRIPNPGKPAVVLQHGLLDTAATWVINGAKESLGYILHDAGYDVFLCNSRGNKYSLKHATMASSSSDFWKFDWDNHAKSDVPACINTAKAVSKQPTVVYIGHSQGGTIGFAALTTTKIASSVSGFIALAPVTYLRTQRSKLFGLMAQIKIDVVLGKLPAAEFVPLPDQLSKLLGGLCSKTPGLCGDALSALFGEMSNVDPARMGVYTAHWPDRTSIQNMVHWIQSARAGNFPAMNGKSIYNPSLITVPTAIYYGTKDSLGDTADEQTLIDAVKRSGKLSDSQGFDFGHMDFVWAKSAASTVYPKVLEQLKKFTAAAKTK